MSLRGFPGACATLLAFSGIALAAADEGGPAAGSAPADEAPNYDSKYATGTRLSGAADNTPEADARPGERYFQEGVRAFQKREFKFAVQMYQVAASWAYKPAEFNLGVIYARGQGVPADLPRAMAWMMLAAERNEQRYVDAREAVRAALTPAQVERVNAIWAELKNTYGDEVALRRAKAQWAYVRSHMTGSRVGSVGHLDVGMPGGSGNQASARVAGSLGPQVRQGANPTASTPGEVAGGQAVDGSIAYRQLLESDNPYDPKFEHPALGTATVGAPVTTGPAGPTTGDKSDPSKHDR
jgi:hypothetical protein